MKKSSSSQQLKSQHPSHGHGSSSGGNSHSFVKGLNLAVALPQQSSTGPVGVSVYVQHPFGSVNGSLDVEILLLPAGQHLSSSNASSLLPK